MNTIIKRVDLFHCQVRLGLAYAGSTVNVANSLIVRLASDAGDGWGEVFMPAPQLLWSWAQRVAPSVIAHDAVELDTLLDTVWPNDRPRMTLEQCGTFCHPDIDCVAEAFSIAWHDFVARQRGVPLCALLGEPKRWRIPGRPCITLGTPDWMAAGCVAWQRGGYRYIKIKLSGDPDLDGQRVRAVREAIGPQMDLQVDANNIYPTLDSAGGLIDVLNDCTVEVIEDLFAIGNIDAVLAAKRLLKGRYMVDKDSHWPHVQRVLDLGAADLVNLHPHNMGRLTYAMCAAAAAEAVGVGVAIGASGVFGIQDSAYQHLAAVVGLEAPCEDITKIECMDGPAADFYHFSDRPAVLHEPHPIRDGDIHLRRDPGLGVQVDPLLVKNFTVNQSTYE